MAGDPAADLWLAAKSSLDRGEWGAAYVLAKRIIERAPTHAEALHAIGLILTREGRAEEALEWFERAVTVRGDVAAWHRNWGVAGGLADRWEVAERAYRRCLELSPGTGAAWLGLARSMESRGRRAEAAAVYSDCVGRGLADSSVFEAAGDFHERAQEAGVAARYYTRLVEVCPELSRGWRKLAASLMRIGALGRAISALERAVELEPDDRGLRSALLFARLNDPGETGESLLAAHRAWGRRHGSGLVSVFENGRGSVERLRLGFVIGESFGSSIRFFLPALLRRLRATGFETYCYSVTGEAAPDGLFSCWRDVAVYSDEAIAAAIRADGIGVLVDVSGHMAGNRLGVFGLRPAPVVVSYPRYPGPTGLDAIGWRITDEWVDPVGRSETHYSERLVRVSSGYLCYEPPAECPEVGGLPADRNGFVTFGFFQSPLKLNGGVFDAVAGVLRDVRRSRVLFHHAFAEYDRPGSVTQEWIVGELESRGVSRERVDFRGRLGLCEHLELLTGVDVALDSFPYNGQTTTCECLWMGVPVVVLQGDRHAGRVGYSLLARCGLEDWVGGSMEEYVGVAVSKARDIGGLRQLRSDLRAIVRCGLVETGSRVGDEIGEALRRIWLEAVR